MSGRGYKSASFRKPNRTKAMQAVALMQCILNRDTFTERDIEGLARGYGRSVEDVRAMVSDELARREARHVGAA